MNIAPARPGFIVVDSALSVVASNAEAIQILTFPDKPEGILHLDSWLANKIRVSLVERNSAARIVGEFHSARRRYHCRSFPVELAAARKNGNHKNGRSENFLIVMFERTGNETVLMAEVAERYGLTTRERETVEFLLEGFTSKEIAERMKISPNTVKAFIRLVMVKMGVSTRSGIIGKLAGSRAGSENGASNGRGKG
ncbi:MAG: LuxR C-terminal-related transcriptional regulator [Candidatus Sulfotelmatobacter sp.]